MTIALGLLAAVVVVAAFSFGLTLFGEWCWKRLMVRMLRKLANKYSANPNVSSLLEKFANDCEKESLFTWIKK